MGSQKGIQDLPDELMVKIFSYLSLHDVVHRVQYVNDHWHNISHDFELWKHLPYRPCLCETENEVLEVLRKAPKLESLILRERDVESIVLNTCVDNCPKLKRLELSASQKLSIRLLKNIVQKCPDIEFLEISNHVIKKKCKAEIIGNLNKLKTLRIGGWYYPATPVYLKSLADGCPALQAIDIKDNLYTNEDLAYFLSKKKHQLHTLFVMWNTEEGECTIPLLKDCENLKTLHVYSCFDVKINHRFDSFRKLKSVTSLALRFLHNFNINYLMEIFERGGMCQLFDLIISYYEAYEDRLAEVIVKNCPYLKCLSIEECKSLTDQSVVNFHNLKQLQRVNLRGSGITDEGVVHLSKCRKLRYLNLNSCGKLTGKNMGLLTEFSELQVLKLNHCDISGLPLILIPSKLKHLKLLIVNYCLNVDQNAVKELKKQMPQLLIDSADVLPRRCGLSGKCAIMNY